MSARGPFVPVDQAALRRAAERVGAASKTLDVEAQALIELAEDLLIDATRRLRERGASAAQVERYEDAYRTRVRSYRAAADSFREAAQELAEV